MKTENVFPWGRTPEIIRFLLLKGIYL